MKTMGSPVVIRATVAVALALLCTDFAWSADPASAAPAASAAAATKPTASAAKQGAPASKQAAPSKEVRSQMAAVHEQMAACLRSDKSIADCRAEVMKSCRDTMGTQCPLMGMGPGTGSGMMQPAPGKPTK